MQKAKLVCLSALMFSSLSILRAQDIPGSVKIDHSETVNEDAKRTSLRSTYTLSPDDEVIIQGIGMDEATNRPYRIDPDGNVSLPMLGRVKAAGLTLHDFELELDQAASKYIRHPQVAASLAEYHGQPVSVVGAVNRPGTQQLEGKKTLMQVMSMVGGFRNDAGNTISIARELKWGVLPLPNTTIDPTGTHSIAQISIPELLQEKPSELNILIMPNDVISVPVSETIYILGDVRKPGGFLLGQRKTVTVTEAVALAQGLSSTSDARHSRIIRHSGANMPAGGIPINLKQVLAGKAQDVLLEGGDTLFVPGSLSKKAGAAALDVFTKSP
ncbi:MAG TPA: polysaccharide biosynthesis/export family protein [Candidatus Acidoferrales bacterium]|jgi:polysaccharide export outer membrane protein|nr:polysaccharide biosynthesis/export family protein [Candidatus Acidoferrales bacterium]